MISLIVYLLKEKSDGISGSIRTTTSIVNASKIAEYFGGGGHERAAGFTVKDLSLMEVEQKVIGYVRDIQDERLGYRVVKEEAEKVEKERKKSEPVKKVAEKKATKKESTKSKLKLHTPAFEDEQVEEENEEEKGDVIYKFGDTK